ncbi:DUF2789 domain-containing protein [Azovibrio restrictus]|uniref:DUF2789 domain-containing protein n=1 Tax=Azovibrio restrictus TaxID=146938 RepID=UPI0026F361CA|nr:DUF2789 domain-containing protein [Azovibrio restrictus]MDD3481598.1 DUF2789 domain-containing protein [Azovibrio restrictus]
MELCHHDQSNLFAQLGLASDPASQSSFIARHAPLPPDLPLAAAPFWNTAQATFLREKLLDDSDWAEAIDELDCRLRA